MNVPYLLRVTLDLPRECFLMSPVVSYSRRGHQSFPMSLCYIHHLRLSCFYVPQNSKLKDRNHGSISAFNADSDRQRHGISSDVSLVALKQRDTPGHCCCVVPGPCLTLESVLEPQRKGRDSSSLSKAWVPFIFLRQKGNYLSPTSFLKMWRLDSQLTSFTCVADITTNYPSSNIVHGSLTSQY